MGASTTQPSLTILGGPMTGKQYVIEEGMDNVLIGSDPSCAFHLPLPGVSPIHARLWIDASGVTVYDTNSPRGLFVNDDRVNGQAPLRNGDILWLGSPGDTDVVMIQCRVPARAAAVVTPAPVPLDATTTLSGESETVLVAAQAAAEVAPPEPVLEVVDDTPPTIIDTTGGQESAFEVVSDEPATQWAEGDVPTMAIDAPPIPPPPVAALPAVPAFFEDETISETPTVRAEAPAASEPEMAPTILEAPRPVTPPVPATPPLPPPAAPRASVPAEAKPAAPRPAPPAAAAPPRKPAAAAPRAAAPAAKTPMKRARGGGSGAKIAIAVVAAVLVVGAAAFFALPYLNKPPVPAPPTTVAASLPPATTAPPITAAPDTTPSTVAEAPPSTEPVEESVTIVKPTPSPAASPKTADAGRPSPPALPSAKPTPATKTPTTQAPGPDPQAQIAARVGDLLGQADSALAGHKYEAAAGIYDEVLKLDAQNSRATTGKTSALSGIAAAKRAFVAGRTSVQSGKAAKGGVSGFDSADVSVAKAPDYSGRIEFEAPASVRPGDSYSIKIYLVNDGKKDFKIGGLAVTTTANGTRAGGGGAPPTASVNPQQRVLLQDVAGTWQDNVNSWSLEVVVTSNHNDTFKNTLSWR